MLEWANAAEGSVEGRVDGLEGDAGVRTGARDDERAAAAARWRRRLGGEVGPGGVGPEPLRGDADGDDEDGERQTMRRHCRRRKKRLLRQTTFCNTLFLAIVGFFTTGFSWPCKGKKLQCVKNLALKKNCMPLSSFVSLSHTHTHNLSLTQTCTHTLSKSLSARVIECPRFFSRHTISSECVGVEISER